MKKVMVHVICGPGMGKTASALGYGMLGVIDHKKVIVVQFLKGELDGDSTEMMKRLEPEMKVFRFERTRGLFEDLTEEQKQEELFNMKNGFNYAKKVLSTGECELLILDEILGLLDRQIISLEDLEGLLAARDDETEVILTGRVCPEEIKCLVDCVSFVENIKVDNSCE